MDNIARLNIAHFRAMLVAEQDEAKRLILRQSLAKEEAQLAMLEDRINVAYRRLHRNRNPDRLDLLAWNALVCAKQLMMRAAELYKSDVCSWP